MSGSMVGKCLSADHTKRLTRALRGNVRRLVKLPEVSAPVRYANVCNGWKADSTSARKSRDDRSTALVPVTSSFPAHLHPWAANR